MIENRLWSEKYRPQKISECVLPKQTRKYFEQILSNGFIPNLLLVGGPGSGKTTSAKAMMTELGMEMMVINGSMKGNIDTLRNEIQEFASSVSFSGSRKYVLIDEADHLSSSTQAGMRSFMEEFSSNCGFILTCNYKNKLIEPLWSRLSEINFDTAKSEKKTLILEMSKRIIGILRHENVDIEDNKIIAHLVTKFFPDFRKTINELQNYCMSGTLDVGILGILNSTNTDDLIKYLKEKDFAQMREWVAKTPMDIMSVIVTLYKSKNVIKSESLPQLILIMNKYDYQNSFCVSKEINMVAMLLEIMLEVKFE